MKKLLSIIIFLFTVNSSFLLAQTRDYNVAAEEEEARKKQKLEEVEEELLGLTLHFCYTMFNSSAFLDGKSDSKSRFIDSTTWKDEVQYAYTSKGHTFLFGGTYDVNPKFKVGMSIPISLYTHDENFLDISSSGSVIGQYEKYSESIFQIDYIDIKASYGLLARSFFSDAYLSIIIPTTSRKDLADLNSFSRHSPFEISPGIKFGTKSQRASMTFDLGYRLRSGKYSDMIRANLDILLTTVPDTEVRTFIHNGISIDKIDDEQAIDIRNNAYSEIYSNFGFAFEILIEKVFYAEFLYQIVVFGKNTRAGSGYMLAVGFRF